MQAIDAVDLKPQWQIDHATRRAALASSAANDTDPAPFEAKTDLGNARRLIRQHGQDLRYVPARGVWLTWGGARWGDDETADVIRRAKESAESLWEEARAIADDDARKIAYGWAAKCQSRSSIVNSVELAKTEAGVVVRVDELDADPWLLNVQNGTLDLRTKEHRAPDRAALMTKCCGAPYYPGARSELWGDFVRHTFGGDADLIAYVQRALGYALFGAWREKHFWFGYGPGDGGKSTFFGAVANALGSYHTTAAASTWIVQSNSGGNRGDLVRLLGARLVTTSEIREGARIDEEVVKRITGGDPIVAAAKYEGEIEFKPTFALWWFANDAPTIRDDDNAMWIRARVVPFTNVVPKHEQDTELPAKLARPEHSSAVLAWLVDGCLAWQREGLGSCAAVDEASRAYRGSMNRLAAFVDAHLILTGDAADEVPNKRMRAVYEEWCRTNGVRAPLQGKAFGARLRELGVLGGDDASKKAVKCEGPSRLVAMKRTEQDRHWRGVRIEGVKP